MEAWPCSPDFQQMCAQLRELCCARFMAQVCMRRGDLSRGGPVQGLKTPVPERDWLLLVALSAPAQAHPGLPEAGGPGPGR